MSISSFTFSQLTSDSSRYELYVFDNVRLSPIENAHVLVVNSTAADYTDDSGKVTFNARGVAGQTILVSHVSYEILTIDIPLTPNLRDTVFLSEITHSLDGVIVTGEQNNLKAKRLRQFKKDVFESDVKNKSLTKLITLENENKILFAQKNDVITATCDELLDIQNEYLGYDLKLFLDRYEHGDSTILYKGKVAFIDRNIKKSLQKKVDKRRVDLWSVSMQKFLQDLVRNQLSESPFRITQKHPDGFWFVQRDIEKYVYKTRIDNVYALDLRLPITVVNGQYTSVLLSSTDVMLISSEGVVMNPDDITLAGYWQRLSLTEQLPTTYYVPADNCYASDQKTAMSLASIKSEIKSRDNELNEVLIQEIQLETDRLIYRPGEVVYTSATLYDHRKNTLLIDDELVYFEVIDLDKQVILFKTKLSEQGISHAGFTLPDSLKSGQYIVRAYTDYMKNFDPNLSPYKVIGVNLIQRFFDDEKLMTDTVKLDFHPEGGHLVEGQKNRVIAHISNHRGAPIPFEGQIINQTDQKSYPFISLLDGLAYQNIEYAAGDQYKIRINENIFVEHNLNDLPTDIKPGLKIQTRDAEFIKIYINRAMETDSLALHFYQKGKNIYSLNALTTKGPFSISKSFLPRDILEVILTNKEGENLSETLIDNRENILPIIDIKKEYAFYYAGSPVEFEIFPQFESGFFVNNLPWNIKVIHENYTRNDKENIGYISSNNFQLNNPVKDLSETNRTVLKNLQMSRSSIKPAFETAYQKTLGQIIHPRRGSHTFSGTTIDGLSDLPTSARVSITTLESDFFYAETVSDEDGRFEFDSIPYLGPVAYIIQARIGGKAERNMEGGNSLVRIEMDREKISGNREYIDVEYDPTLAEIDTSALNLSADKYAFSTNVILDEVVISANQKRMISPDVKTIAEMEWVDKRARGTNLIQSVYPGAILRNSLTNPAELEIRIRVPGSVDVKYVTVIMFINGIRQVNTAMFNSLAADQIMFMTLSGQVLIVNTFPGMQSLTEVKNPGITDYVHPSTIDETSISDVNDIDTRFSVENNYRKTIYWNPAYYVSSDGSNKIVTNTTSLTGNYVIEASTVHQELGVLKYRWMVEIREE